MWNIGDYCDDYSCSGGHDGNENDNDDDNDNECIKFIKMIIPGDSRHIYWNNYVNDYGDGE